MMTAAVSAGAVCARSRWSKPARARSISASVSSARGSGNGATKMPAGQRRVPGAIAGLRRRHRHRQMRATVEAAGEHDDVRTSGRLLRELHRSFGDLGTRVRVEERVDAGRCDLGEAIGERLEQIVAVAVDLRVHEPLGLGRDRGDDLRMRVAGGGDRDARSEVEVLDAVGGGDPAAVTGRNLEVGDREPHVRQMRRRHFPRLRVRATMVEACSGDHADARDQRRRLG